MTPVQQGPQRTQPRKPSRPSRRLRRRAGLLALKTFAPALVRALARTWRVEVRGEEHRAALPQGSGHLVCLWHGRMLVGSQIFGHQGYRVLVSPSADGDLSQELLLASGYAVLRGSSSRGGARALREMLDYLRAGEKVVVTPDGPRGPRHSINPGLAWMARATGYPVIPIGLVADRAWSLRSWDRFTIPKPRARVIAAWGAPVWVARRASDEEVRSASEDLRRRTIDLEVAGFASLGKEPDW